MIHFLVEFIYVTLNLSSFNALLFSAPQHMKFK